MKKAIVFDLDGTIADTISAIAEGINLTMELYGFPTHTVAEARTYINNGPRMLIRRALPKERQEDEELIDRALADYNRFYQTVYLHTDRTYDGIPALLKSLRAEGYRIGVLSNKQDFLVGPLCEQLIPGLFDASLGSLPDHPTKPHPYLSQRIASMLGVNPEDCLMIGDSDVDIRTAQNAGMTHVGVTWGYRNGDFLRENGAIHLADTPEELLLKIQQLSAGKDD